MPDPGPRPRLVVIDGPAGAGKSTVAKALARRLSLPFLDTGALYRSLALTATRRGVGWDDADRLATLALDLRVEFSTDAGGGLRVVLAGEDVTAAIRTAEMSQGASRVSQYPAVRAALLPAQRALGATGCVAEGRDVGTVVFPDAPHKFFLTADLATRARRRREELLRAGRDMSFPEVVAEVRERDARDAGRAAAPLARAHDAAVIDTSSASVEEVVAAMAAMVESAGPAT